MSGRGKHEAKLQKAREEVARRDARISEMERANARLQRLYDISKVLTRFQDVRQTVPAVVAIVARLLPLRTAIFALEIGDARQTIAWLADGESEQRLREAEARVHAAYRYLVRSGNERELEPQPPLELPRLPASDANAGSTRKFVMLPFAVDPSSIFGALQIEAACELEEADLIFVNAVVNQLAVALDRYSAEGALRASEARLSGLVSTAADAIVSVDEAQRIIMYNEGAEKIFGWSRDEVLGKTLDMLLPSRFREAHRRHILDFAAHPDMARQLSRRPAIYGLRKSGEEFPAEAAVSKLKVGAAWLFTVILRDVTEQDRIEHGEKFLVEVASVLATTLDFQDTLTAIAELVIRDMADFCIIEFVDEQGELQRLHVASFDPAKAGIAEALKRVPLDRSRPHLSRAAMQTRESQLAAQVSPEELRALAQHDEHLRLLEAIAPASMMAVPLLLHGRLLGVLVALSSRAERRFGASDLRLLEEVGRRAAAALQNAWLYRALARAVQMRDDVLGIVAHDLRNPLNSILMASAVIRDAGQEERRRTDDPAETIRRAAMRMDRLIQDLLDVTRMEAGRLSVDQGWVSARQLVADSVRAEKALASSAALEIRLDVAQELPDIWADRDRLLQVFENLIGNAVKFTTPGGRITVGAAPRDGEVLFWVADTGDGIAAVELPHLFDRFWQVRQAGRGGGAGLGLAIAKGIVEAHGGRIWVESPPEAGSTFFYTIPTARRVAPARAETALHGA